MAEIAPVRLFEDPLAPLLRRLDRPAHPSSDYDLAPMLAPSPRTPLKPAAVLVAFVEGAREPEVLLTRRSAALRHHPGQISLPGGRHEPGDADLFATALREAEEEVGLPASAVTPLGRLPEHRTVTGFSVTPILGRVQGSFAPRPDRREVDEVFRVPFSHLADPGRYRIEERLRNGQSRPYYVLPWGPYYIWGATARILRGLAERVHS